MLRAEIDRRAGDAMPPFVRKLLAIPDPSIRCAVVGERLLRCDTHGCLAILSGLLHRALRRDEAAQAVLIDLLHARPLAERLGYHRARLLYELARSRGHYALARILLSPDALLGKREPEPDWENKHMQDTSLGWRKTLARGPDRLKLDRLLFDRNPQVVALLLQNPRITERDVVRMAAMRPANPAVLDTVFRHPRWVRRYHVRVALALNPSTPIDIALALLPGLQLPDLRYASVCEPLPDELRDAARQALAERPRADGGSPTPLQFDIDALAEQLETWMAPGPR